MMFSAEQGMLKGQEQFDQMVAFVRRAAGDGRSIHEVECGLWERLLVPGRAVLGSFVAGVGTGDLGPTLSRGGGREVTPKWASPASRSGGARAAA